MKFQNDKAERLYEIPPDDEVGSSSEGIGWAGKYTNPRQTPGGSILFESTQGDVSLEEFHDNDSLEEAWRTYKHDLEPSGEPEEDDYVIQDHNEGYEVNHDLGTFPNFDSAIQGIRDRMEADKFWPNVWALSDHGNYHLITEIMK